MDKLIRWLHLSDFHVGKDGYAQKRLLEKIIEHVKDQVKKGFIPDLVFITGDIANKGLKAEYETFRKEFYNPLEEALGGKGWAGKLYAVPGNHDVVRPVSDGLNRQKLVEPASRFFDPNKQGKTAREQVTPRFKQFKHLMPCHATNDWLVSAEGAFAEKQDIYGQPIGVVGINTAWFSMDEHDKDKLTPGLSLVEAALEKLQECSVRIVIGHHPLHWLIEDDARRLRTLFGRHRVIYLHGHMHRAEANKIEGAGESFLAIQAGAAFQARDNELWRNGLLWAELDLAQNEIRLSPRFWNPDNYDWPVETGRFPEKLKASSGEWWVYPLPESDEIKCIEWQPPEGWSVLNRDRLETYRRDISAEDTERFFDGAEPDWALAQCPQLPRRAVVNRLMEKIAAYRSNERPLVVLLTGPGGEGKSMAWRQAVVGLLEQQPKLQVLWRNEDMATISAEQLLALPKGDWLIATDAADLNIKAIHEAMEGLSRSGRNDVRFLLTARESDWRAAGGKSLDWRRAHFDDKEVLSGLSQEDATLITRAWMAFGDVHDQKDAETLARSLFDAAKSEAALGEGALLGGVLVIRRGDGLRAHVKHLLNRLDASKLASGHSLRDAFVYIAAMHAEDLDFLSRPVLAEALGCATNRLQQDVLFRLGREAAAGGGTMIRTRHRRIAMAVIDVMREDFGEDIGQYYVTLSRTAMIAWGKRTRIPKLDAWEYVLPKHFLKRQHHELAIQIAETVLEQAPDNPKLAVNLAKIYRQSDEPAEGARVLREFNGEVSNTRGFWYEWATCAGNVGNHVLGAWLGGCSLADQQGVVSPDNDQTKMSLAGLGIAFAELFQRYSDRAFVEAEFAAAQLGMQLRLDTTAQYYFKEHLAHAEAEGVVSTDLPRAIARLQTGLTKAWECCAEQEGLKERIPRPHDMHFDGLKRLFNLI